MSLINLGTVNLVQQRALTQKQVIFRLGSIILIVEFFIMLLLGMMDYELDTITEAALDVFLLAVFTTPLIYFCVIKPFVVDRDNALAQISELAHTDPLTKLPNRRLLSLQLDKFLAKNVRHKTYGALLLIDLDGFKSINDEYGHDAGDAVLVEVASRLQVVTRAEDVVSRLGGDEFVVLIQYSNVNADKSTEITMQVSQKIVGCIEQPVEFNGKHLNVGASIGIRMLSLDQQLVAETIIKDADTAMYRAKKAGKGVSVIF